MRLKSMISVRKLLVFSCLVALLLAALTPASAGLLWAILVPLLFFVADAKIVWAERLPEESEIPALCFLPVVASRPPPVPAHLN